MENQLQIFSNPDFGDIRAIEVDGEPWLVGKDIAISLGYLKPENAVATHVDAEDKTTTLIQGNGSNYKSKAVLINESGVYALILGSKLPNAKKFKRWVTSEILPSIRKNGFYATPEKIEDIVRNPDRFIEELMAAYKRVKAERDKAQAQVALLEPKADYCDKVLLSDEHLTSELIAKEYGRSATWLNNILVQSGVIFKRGKNFFLKAKYANMGYRVSETIILDGGKTVTNHYWTQKSRNFIYHFLKDKYGIVPTREHLALACELF